MNLARGRELGANPLAKACDLAEDEEGVGDSGLSDMDEFQLMYKLRKELGDADFNAIFNDRRIQGPDLK